TMAAAHNNLADELRIRKDFAGALKSAQEAVRLQPNVPAHYVSLGSALHNAGHLNEAGAASIGVVAGDIPAHLNGSGRLDESVAAFRKAISLRPDLAMAHYNLGLTLKDKGDHDEAIVAFQEVLRIQPDHPGAHPILAELFQARRAFEK